MSLQQIQNMDILQLPALELTDRIYKELEENPTLEIIEPENSVSNTVEQRSEDTVTGENLQDNEPVIDDQDIEPGQTKNVLDILDNEREFPSRRRSEYLREFTERKAEAMQNTPAKPESIQDYLFFQFEMMDLPEQMKMIGNEIIYNISDDGYFKTNLDDVALGCNKRLNPDQQPVTTGVVSEVLRIVQKLDPPGVAARSLPECLILQLQEIDPDLELKKIIIAHHLEHLHPNKLPALARILKKPFDRIERVVAEIKLLNPRPSSDFSADDVGYITPDVVISKVDSSFEIKVRNEYFPGLMISEYYARMVKSKTEDKNTKQFIRQKILSAMGLIQAIQLRKVTLRQLSEQILALQYDFFESGVRGLKPLRMKEVAKNLKVHLSTISRIIANKYIQTPHGLFPAKFFFLSTTETAEGNFYSMPNIQSTLKEIIEKENKNKPLRDLEIGKALAEKQLKVSRRTISKYRQVMNIPSFTHRKITDNSKSEAVRAEPVSPPASPSADTPPPAPEKEKPVTQAGESPDKVEV